MSKTIDYLENTCLIEELKMATNEQIKENIKAIRELKHKFPSLIIEQLQERESAYVMELNRRAKLMITVVK